MQLRVTALFLLCVLGAQPAELPVKQIALYKHGVGYLNARARSLRAIRPRLDFKASQMNDVLKSLSITEKNGGKVSGIRYDSSIPLDEKLSDFPFKSRTVSR